MYVAPLVKDLTISISRHMNMVKSLLLSLHCYLHQSMANTVIHTHTPRLTAFHMGEGQGEAKHIMV